MPTRISSPTSNRFRVTTALVALALIGMVPCSEGRASGSPPAARIGRVALWYNKRPPAPEEEILFRHAEIVLIGYPGTLDPWWRGLRKRGIKVLPYVSFYKLPNVADVPETNDWDGGSPARSELARNPFWREVSTDEHPEWIARDDTGKAKRPFDNDGYMEGWNQSRPDLPSYREACRRGIQALMRQGYDGVFIDNVREAHQKMVVDAANLVHSLESDALVVMNGHADDQVNRAVNCRMLESFIYSWAWDLGFFQRAEWQDYWKKMKDQAWEPGSGAQPLALGYLGFSGRSAREDAYTLLSSALILGFAFSDAGTALDPSMVAAFARKNLFQGGTRSALQYFTGTSHDSWVGEFYSVNLGAPRGRLMEQNGCVVRYFARGLCVFNPTGQLARVSLEWPGKFAYEAACGTRIESRNGQITLYVAPFSGRVALIT